jgi:glycosyltransferase involved in cell wall biosynthesis
VEAILKDKKVVVAPAYNTAKTLRRTVDEIPREIVDEVILTDDASRDTFDLALGLELGLITIRHDHNRGYGGNQKACCRAALDRGAEIVVMLHPEYQYIPKLVSAMAAMIAHGEYDRVVASRIQRRGALKGGRAALQVHLEPWSYVHRKYPDPGEDVGIQHPSYRGWNRPLLERLP